MSLPALHRHKKRAIVKMACTPDLSLRGPEGPRNSPEDRAECAALCEQYGLIHTGGTDFHGANHKVPHPVGTCTTADDQVARILELAHKRRGIDV